MKKAILLTTMFMLIISNTKAQMTLEATYNAANAGWNDINPVVVVNLLLSGKKYAVTNVDSYQVRLYNLDYSLWKTITLPTVTGYYPIMVYYISENLFAIDGYVDMVIDYSGGGGGGTYEELVIDELGATLNTLNNSVLIKIFNTGTDSFVAVTGYGSTYKVYSLPGTIPCDVCGNGLGLANVPAKSSGVSEPIPNPSSNKVKITFTLPEGTKQGELDLYSVNGQLMKTYKVDNTFGFIYLDNSELPAGMYYYNLIADGSITTTKKMIVLK